MPLIPNPTDGNHHCTLLLLLCERCCFLSFSLAKMSSSSVESMNGLLYHRYLKGESLYSDTCAPTGHSYPATPKSKSLSQFSSPHGDLQESFKSLFPTFDYISSKLSQQGLSIHLIVSDQCPFVIPVWELPLQSRITLCGIIRKACRKCQLAPGWMTTLASLSKKDLPKVFESYRADAYVVRRSMLQREVIYSSGGLTLLTIDHIYTLKQLLCTLSKKEWVSISRESCLASCVHLLNRIHSVYTGKPASAAYIERVYKEVPFHEDELKEVVTEYNARFCTATIKDVSFQPEYASLPLEEEEPERPSHAVQELPDSGMLLADHNTNAGDELVSPIEPGLDMVRTREVVSLGHFNPNNVFTSPTSISTHHIPPPAGNGNILRNTLSSNRPITITRQTKFPPPSSPPPSYPLPSPPSTSTRRDHHSRNHFSTPSSSTFSSLPVSSLTKDDQTDDDDNSNNNNNNNQDKDKEMQQIHHHSLPPRPLKIIKHTSSALSSSHIHPRTFPPPPDLPSTLPFPLLAPSVFTTDSDINDECASPSASAAPKSAVDGEFLWELHVLESPRSFIESWSRGTVGALCRRCHEVVEG